MTTRACVDRSLIESAQIALRLLKERHLTIVTAESCTAGLISAVLSQADGASDVLHGSFVVYTKANKAEALGVDAALLRREGGVNAEARLVSELPTEAGWQYGPKWDGFRCLAFRRNTKVELRAKSGKPLTRYFPEVVAALGQLRATQFVLDGELIIPHGNAPGGQSRWSTERGAEWVPLKPKLVAEVRYDHVTSNRFRHGTKFLRWRPDKAPRPSISSRKKRDRLSSSAAFWHSGAFCKLSEIRGDSPVPYRLAARVTEARQSGLQRRW